MLRDPFLYESLRHLDLFIPNDIGIVKAVCIIHSLKITQTPEVGLMHDICRLAAKNGYRVFIFGAKEEVSQSACEKLEKLYPGLLIVGRAEGMSVNRRCPH